MSASSAFQPGPSKKNRIAGLASLSYFAVRVTSYPTGSSPSDHFWSPVSVTVAFGASFVDRVGAHAVHEQAERAEVPCGRAGRAVEVHLAAGRVRCDAGQVQALVQLKRLALGLLRGELQASARRMSGHRDWRRVSGDGQVGPAGWCCCRRRVAT
jgi:hypothetical protein